MLSVRSPFRGAEAFAFREGNWVRAPVGNCDNREMYETRRVVLSKIRRINAHARDAQHGPREFGDGRIANRLGEKNFVALRADEGQWRRRREQDVDNFLRRFLIRALREKARRGRDHDERQTAHASFQVTDEAARIDRRHIVLRRRSGVY